MGDEASAIADSPRWPAHPECWPSALSAARSHRCGVVTVAVCVVRRGTVPQPSGVPTPPVNTLKATSDRSPVANRSRYLGLNARRAFGSSFKCLRASDGNSSDCEGDPIVGAAGLSAKRCFWPSTPAGVGGKVGFR
mgnify:CR=1 FL=1